MKEKVILAYSGGLDTSVSIKWLTDQGYDVVACCLDIGEGRDTESPLARRRLPMVVPAKATTKYVLKWRSQLWHRI